MVDFLNNVIKFGLEFYGRYYSSYPGLVIDNNDVDGQNKLLVSAPTVWARNDYSKWAFPRGGYSGDNYGIQLLPEVGDMVNITFENGNPKYPRWEYAHPLKGKMPPEFKEISTKGFITPNGTKILLTINEDGSEDLKIISNGTIIYNKGEHTTAKADVLKKELEKMSSRLDSILSALKNASPDSAAGTFKSSLVLLLADIKESEDFSEIENTKIKHS